MLQFLNIFHSNEVYFDDVGCKLFTLTLEGHTKE